MKTARAGFTLLEVLLAMALMSMLAGTLYTTLHIAFRARESLQRGADQGSAGQLALDLMCRDLAEALPPTGTLASDFEGTPAGSQSGAGTLGSTFSLGRSSIGASGGAAMGQSNPNADDVSFYAAAHTGTGELPEGDVCLIELTIGNDEDGQPALIRNTTTDLLAPVTPTPTTEVLCRNVQGLNFYYFDGSTWTDSWDSTQENNQLPVAIEVTLTLKPDATAAQNGSNVLTRIVPLPCATAAQQDLLNLPSGGPPDEP